MSAAFEDQPIIALCTPQGSGALALIRLSGRDCLTLASHAARLSSGAVLDRCATHTIHHGFVYDSEGDIDEVLFLVMRSPKTFTGEDTLEITCHNNPFIIERIIQVALSHGARVAYGGEFSRRAVFNNRIDIVQAEATREVIAAQSEYALREHLENLKGTLSHYFSSVINDATALLSFVEASFEFLDEEQRDLDFDQEVIHRLEALCTKITKLTEEFQHQQRIKDGVRIALIGSVNAGKSTLLNALTGKDRSIVSSIPGTTRDTVEASMHRNGLFWTFVDTAGLRMTHDTIEQEGIDRSWQEARRSDIVLFVFDGSCDVSSDMLTVYYKIAKECVDKILVAVNKVDTCHGGDNTQRQAMYIQQLQHDDVLWISARDGTAIEALRIALQERVQSLFDKNSPFLLTVRQHRLLCGVNDLLRKATQHTRAAVEYELVSYHVREALTLLADLTGKGVHEKMLDEVFSGFCVGK